MRTGAAAAFTIAMLAGIAPVADRAGASPDGPSRSAAGQAPDPRPGAPAGRVEEHAIASKR